MSVIEHRTYWITPGRLAEYLEAYGTAGYPIQKRYLGECCVGSYLTEVGVVPEMTMLWRFASLDERMARKAENDRDADWQRLMRTGLAPNVDRIVTKAVTPAPYWEAEDARGAGLEGAGFPFVEQRICSLRPAGVAAWLESYGGRGFAIQSRHLGEACLGSYVSQIGTIQEVTTLWGFSSLDDRHRRRRAMEADPEWRALVRDALAPAVERVTAKVMAPTPYWRADKGQARQRAAV